MKLDKTEIHQYSLGTPEIDIIRSGITIAKINTLRFYEETKDSVILEFDNYIPEIKRGLLCDFVIKWNYRDSANTVNSKSTEMKINLLCVEVSTKSTLDDFVRKEYTFYKE